MGTRGVFGVIIGEKEKLSYNHWDSYPSGKGAEILQWLRGVIDEERLDEIRDQAAALRLVSDDVKPTPDDIASLEPYTNLGVSEQSTDDWYCLTHATQGDPAATLESGYMLDASYFPLDSLFCEWGYVIDLDAMWDESSDRRGIFEVYQGFQKELPKAGRWAGRPTPEEDEKAYAKHLKWCAKNDREPWLPEVSEFKAIELVKSWPLDALPSDGEFIAALEPAEEEAKT
jgi:hypothetical protein